MEEGEEKKPSRDEDTDGSFSHTNYREAIVKLFNTLCEEAQRIYGDTLGHLTPRELQEELVKRIPEGDFAIEDLVSTFEAVSYGVVEPTREEFDRCEATVDLLMGLMDGSSPVKIDRRKSMGVPISEGSKGGLLNLVCLLLLGGIIFIVLFLFQREIESGIGELARVFRSLFD